MTNAFPGFQFLKDASNWAGKQTHKAVRGLCKEAGKALLPQLTGMLWMRNSDMIMACVHNREDCN